MCIRDRSSAMIPSISGTYALGDSEQTNAKISSAIRITMLIAIPAAVGMTVLARPIVQLLFPQKSSLDLAASLLRCLGVTVVLYSLSTLTNAVLQACLLYTSCMREKGLEPSRTFVHMNLNHARLPIPAFPQLTKHILSFLEQNVNAFL